MYNRVKKFCLRTAAVIMLVLALPLQSFAANARISFSDPSTEAGSEFNVRMKFTSTSGEVLGHTDVMLAYDATALEFLGGSENASGGSGAIRVTSGMEGKTEIVTSLKFRALKAGTTQISVSSWEGYDADGQMVTMDKQGTSTIQIAAGSQTQALSSDASLKSLQISPGTLEPVFSPDVENYTATVSLDTERLTVGAIANHEKAVVSVEGGEALQPGENTVVCRVTAEDGATSRNYTVVVNKAEGGEALNTEETGESAEQLVTQADILVHLEASRTPQSIGITAFPSDAKIPAGMVERDLIIGEATVKGWIPNIEGKEQNPDYCIFYGMNADGEAGYYRYDITDKTIQKYYEYDNSGEMDPAYVELAEKYNELTDDYSTMRYVALGASAAAVVLLMILIILLVKRSRSGHDDSGEEYTSSISPKTGKKLSKEERYMMGEEDNYEEDEPKNEKSQKTAEEKESYLPEEAESVEMVEVQFDDHLNKAVEDVEQAISRNLARAAADTEDRDPGMRAHSTPSHPVEFQKEQDEYEKKQAIEKRFLSENMTHTDFVYEDEDKDEDDDFEVFDLDED